MKKILFLLLFVCTLSFTMNAQSDSDSYNQTLKIKVFPNPATNVVNILGLKNSIKANISISDAYGNKVLEHQWGIKNNALNIPISSLNPGIYIATIRSQEQQIQTKFYKK
ncbi:T9SS type A sorting domain-containing protein [Kriegella sp. EG-1]|nr:T9SS type A sorting domain-containing protein [Flavobacteriaceae bacterium EG-1]